ncbi:MAG: hypothetical protein O2820_14395 [Planctomycetota bacterium]|nr:hypothetical protein [Planctomycetota bacterium]MDA1250403.1 hypothetical protein [Planctomycetota bacterium]
MRSLSVNTVSFFALLTGLAVTSSGFLPTSARADDGITRAQLEDGVTFPVGRGNGGRFVVRAGFDLKGGQAVDISTRIKRPSSLPENARVRAKIVQLDGTNEKEVFVEKILHALDGDLYTPFRAPRDGRFAVILEPAEEELTLFEGERWREAGKVDELLAASRAVAWPGDKAVDVTVQVRQLHMPEAKNGSVFIEFEPNDSPRYAQPIPLKETDKDYSLQILGTHDEVEYFDNGQVGDGAHDDWLRLDYPGKEPRLLTACLTIPDQMVAARIRVYEVATAKANVEIGAELDVGAEYEDGKNPNERVHQQQEQHRIAICRNLKPGHVYFLRVEANSPGYGLELRVVKPAPFTDPRHAIRHGLYDHVGQVDSWLNNRPRGASVERRIRDTGNLLGTQCMSCHTQSGVWGPAIPLAMGYRLENAHLFRNLTNICYQSMRPTNELVDAANNTSLAPLDIGDGPAGTRVAAHSVISLERFLPARKLQSKQFLRASNFVLQTADPGGINAAGPGANVGQGVVFNYTGEILDEAWRRYRNPQFFRALEDKARKTLAVNPKYTDDMAHRVEFLRRFFPQDYVEQVSEVLKLEEAQKDTKPRIPSNVKPGGSVEGAKKLWAQINTQVEQDLARLRAVQNEDGSWGFNPGEKENDTWKVKVENKPEPSPTALALIAFQAAGFGPKDPTVEKGVKALLGLQHPTGFWKGQSQTGFVSTSYALHALSRLYPTEPAEVSMNNYFPKHVESLPERIERHRAASNTNDPALLPLFLSGVKDQNPHVRFWAAIGLGAVQTSTPSPLPVGGEGRVLANLLGDPVKAVREAALWASRQTLIDDQGWEEFLAAASDEDDYRREAAYHALLMRVDGVMPEMSVEWNDLTGTLTRGMNEDAHPAVRAWATRAAWNWWVYNPPVRTAINEAWVKMLQRPESNALVENAIRYQSQALFIANGHKANQSNSHQYKELAELFETIGDWLAEQKDNPSPEAQLVARRLVGIGATFYNTSGGDGGPGQMGFSTPHSTYMFGLAAMTYFGAVEAAADFEKNTLPLQVGLEGSANVSFSDLQQKLIQYSLNGPEDLRPIASSSVSDPRSAQLVAVPERIEPLIRQLNRGAMEPPRRPQLSEPILNMFARIKWVIPDTHEQQHEVFGYLQPEFSAYLSPEKIKAIPDAAERGEAERNADSFWYLARGVGNAIGENPDLHHDVMLEFFPEKLEHPQLARFWLPSVEWILLHKTKLPDVQPGKLPPIDPLEQLRTRALRLFLDQLIESADPETRQFAVKMAQRTALRRNPEVLTALEAMLKFEKREGVVNDANNVLKQNRENFEKELVAAVQNENPKRLEVKDGKLPSEFVEDFSYFRDYVTPEMNRVLRGDQRSCFACHGVPGRVPPLELARPDDAGYLPVGKLLENYRKLQARVDLADVGQSKLLRKPLNVQTGKEDGHQGGRRYQPNDPGYLILTNWAMNQKRHGSLLGHK